MYIHDICPNSSWRTMKLGKELLHLNRTVAELWCYTEFFHWRKLFHDRIWTRLGKVGGRERAIEWAEIEGENVLLAWTAPPRVPVFQVRLTDPWIRPDIRVHSGSCTFTRSHSVTRVTVRTMRDMRVPRVWRGVCAEVYWSADGRVDTGLPRRIHHIVASARMRRALAFVPSLHPFRLLPLSLSLSLPLPRANPCQTVMARRTFFAFFSFSMEKSRLGEGEGERRRNRTAIGSTGCPVTGLRRRILRSRRRVTTPVCVARKQRKY